MGRTTHSVFPTSQNNRCQSQNSDHPRHHQKIGEINEALDRCCQLAQHQPLLGKQLVIMTDASFQTAGYAVLIEDDPNQTYTSTFKTNALIAHSSKTYTPSQIIMSIYAKNFLAFYLAFKEF